MRLLLIRWQVVCYRVILEAAASFLLLGLFLGAILVIVLNEENDHDVGQSDCLDKDLPIDVVDQWSVVKGDIEEHNEKVDKKAQIRENMPQD